jgi:hypothetical protein
MWMQQASDGIKANSASGCVSNMMVHIQIHLMYSDYHHMVS